MTFLNKQELICLHIVKWLHLFLYNTNNFIWTRLNDTSSIWSIDWTLTGTTTPGQSGPGSNGNKGVLPITPGLKPRNLGHTWGGFTLPQRFSQCILQPQLTRLRERERERERDAYKISLHKNVHNAIIPEQVKMGYRTKQAFQQLNSVASLNILVA